MQLFGICFLLYILKISAPKGIWYNLRTADPAAHKVAITYQRHYRRIMKAEMDLKFLFICRDESMYPTHVKWSILKKMKPRERLRHHQRNLKRSITEMHEKLRSLRSQSANMDASLKNALTWMKYKVFKFSISRLIDNERRKVKDRHDKKLDRLRVESAVKNGTKKNPNNLITNLTDETLTREETDVLMLGLNHGIALHPREDEILPVIEGLFSRIKDLNIIRNSHMATERVKYALRSFAYNFIEIEDKNFHKDAKRVKIMKNLRNRFVILKPDKGQGVVLLKKEDYITSMENLFSDRSKFKQVNEDTTIRRVETIKSYINTMFNRGEVTAEEVKQMRRKGANRARARGLPKTHKTFDKIPPFRPVVDTTNTPYSGIGTYLKTLLNPLTVNEFSMKDTFQAVEEIGKIDYTLLEKGYRLVSFDVVSLFTNVPLKRTVNVILDRIYKDKVIETKLKKSTLKKLILDCCTKTTFSFNNKLYDQIDGVCMGSSLGPVLANIIMTELEKKILPSLLDSGSIRSYIRYVDDTLVLIKESEIQNVLDRFNSFDRNLKFTVDTFEDGNIHFLDISVLPNGDTDVYSKPTNTGLYSHYESYIPWRYKTSWARSLFNRAKRICSNNRLFKNQQERINRILSWNGFPSYVRKKMLAGFKESHQRSTTPPADDQTQSTNEEFSLTLKLPYMGGEGEKLVRTLKRKVQSNLSKKVNFKIYYTTSKIAKFCSTKDRIPMDQSHNVIYHIECPGCGEVYVGKTSCCLGKRLDEHGTRQDQPMHIHLSNCSEFQYMVNLLHLPDIDRESRTGINDHILNAVHENGKVLISSDDWLTLAYMEPLLAKKHNATINHGAKAMRSLNLF